MFVRNSPACDEMPIQRRNAIGTYVRKITIRWVAARVPVAILCEVMMDRN